MTIVASITTMTIMTVQIELVENGLWKLLRDEMRAMQAQNESNILRVLAILEKNHSEIPRERITLYEWIFLWRKLRNYVAKMQEKIRLNRILRALVVNSRGVMTPHSVSNALFWECSKQWTLIFFWISLCKPKMYIMKFLNHVYFF